MSLSDARVARHEPLCSNIVLIDTPVPFTGFMADEALTLRQALQLRHHNFDDKAIAPGTLEKSNRPCVLRSYPPQQVQKLRYANRPLSGDTQRYGLGRTRIRGSRSCRVRDDRARSSAHIRHLWALCETSSVQMFYEEGRVLGWKHDVEIIMGTALVASSASKPQPPSIHTLMPSSSNRSRYHRTISPVIVCVPSAVTSLHSAKFLVASPGVH